MKKEREVYADKEAALARLRNNGVSIDTGAKLIITDKRRPPGIKLWGAIDYLKRFAGYDWGWGR
ncbi:MAG: hypothetical protein ABIJ57_07265 [Pseudomonadota bacterium]